MKVLHITTSVSAQSASYRIHRAILRAGIDSYIYVKNNSLDEKRIIYSKKRKNKIMLLVYNFLEQLIFKLFVADVKTPISLGIFSNLDQRLIKKLDPDIIHLHWICGTFISIRDMDFLKHYKVVWTLHDSWGFTGGCHIPYDCKKYLSGCYDCEQVGTKKLVDISRFIFFMKKIFYKTIDFKIVTPSKWLASCAKQSFLFGGKDISIIGNPIDINVYRSIEKKGAKNIFGISSEKKVLLFGAMNSTSDSNKGFQYLIDAIQLLYKTYKKNNDIEIMIFGGIQPENPPDFGYKTTYLGTLNDDISLALLYAVADVMIVPSKSENLPNTVLESLACGTPVVAFDIGGISDLIVHKKNGYLAKPYSSLSLKNGIEFVLEDNNTLSYEARKHIVDRYEEKLISEQYISLYREMR